MTIPLKHRPDGLGEFEHADAVPVWHGGTGATTIEDAQDALGISGKLDRSEYVQHYLGVFPSKAALDAAHPIARPGDYADIDSGSDFDVMRAIWDNSDQKWVVSEAGNASNTDQVPEGSQNLYFTAARVLSTLLTGLTVSNSPISALDTILAAFGKAQGQIENKLSASTWVNAATIGSYSSKVDQAGTKIELSKFNGMIYARGYLKCGSSSINATEVVLSITNPEWQLQIPIEGATNPPSAGIVSVLGTSICNLVVRYVNSPVRIDMAPTISIPLNNVIVFASTCIGKAAT